MEPINALGDAAPGFVWRLVEEGVERLRPLRAEGPSPRAFTFRGTYTPTMRSPCPEGSWPRAS